MNNAALKSDTQEIVIDEVFPHAPETLWKTLTNGELMGRWLMAPTGDGRRLEEGRRQGRSHLRRSN